MSTDSEEPARPLPDNPDIRNLENHAKDLFQAGHAESLPAAQLEIATGYGFASWPELETHVETSQLAGKLKLAIDAEDMEEVQRLMTRHPELHRTPLGASKCQPLTWVAFGGGPPSELPLAMAQWMIANGSDVHQGDDGPLIRSKAELLLDHGADPNARATFRPEDQTHGKATTTEALHGLTPVGYARRYSDRRCVNTPAVAAIIERGGTE